MTGVAAPPASAARLSERARARLQRLLGAWDELVDDRVGVIQRVTQMTPDDDEPSFFHTHSDACDTSAFSKLANFRGNGGVSSDRYIALAKAIGEGVERYCAAIFDYDRLVLAAYEELPQRATPPAAYALHTPAQHADPQFPWQPFEETTPVLWTRGGSLLDGEPVLVPAAMVYVPFHYLLDQRDTPIVQPISTGLACGASPAEAAISGLCEAVERDAFTLTWQARMSRPRIAADTLPDSAQALIERFAAADIRVAVMDITTDIEIATVMTIALSDADSSPAIAVAAATDPSPEHALVKSLEELAHTRRYARLVMQHTPELPVDVAAGHPQIVEQAHHLRFYCPQSAKRFAEFAWSSPEVRDFAELPDRAAGSASRELDALLTAVADRGIDVISCDLTTPDISALGLAVTRIVAPGLHPLFMGYRIRALGGQRLATVPQLLGFPAVADAGDNPYPHPFP